MRESIPVNLGPVQETLLIPLLGRARKASKKHGVLGDPKVVEIVNAHDYDFSKWEGGRSLLGACLRPRMFDSYVEGSALDTEWMERVATTKGPWLVVAEAVPIYFDARREIELIAGRLPGTWIAFDTTVQKMVEKPPRCF